MGYLPPCNHNCSSAVVRAVKMREVQMRFARFFVLRVLLISPTAWPAAAHSFPAMSVQHLLADKKTRRGDMGGGNDSEKRTATADSHGDEESRSADAARAEVRKQSAIRNHKSGGALRRSRRSGPLGFLPLNHFHRPPLTPP